MMDRSYLLHELELGRMPMTFAAHLIQHGHRVFAWYTHTHGKQKALTFSCYCYLSVFV